MSILGNVAYASRCTRKLVFGYLIGGTVVGSWFVPLEMVPQIFLMLLIIAAISVLLVAFSLTVVEAFCRWWLRREQFQTWVFSRSTNGSESFRATLLIPRDWEKLPYKTLMRRIKAQLKGQI